MIYKFAAEGYIFCLSNSLGKTWYGFRIYIICQVITDAFFQSTMTLVYFGKKVWAVSNLHKQILSFMLTTSNFKHYNVLLGNVWNTTHALNKCTMTINTFASVLEDFWTLILLHIDKTKQCASWWLRNFTYQETSTSANLSTTVTTAIIILQYVDHNTLRYNIFHDEHWNMHAKTTRFSLKHCLQIRLFGLAHLYERCSIHEFNIYAPATSFT